ncbi:hypothetical protein [Vibrio splendidus]|uniref:hypothetical protein n=1 Tax=Vibrio splendidus TaxID=29497 RepID=UPI0002E99FD1|nr:hypothetical protein [Vibrio splendidus]OEF44187.1 hypothetical protein A150_14295 [Vibrio splendidus 1S-124]PMN78602.1 hypothetical protein BCT24_05300 [Vibrio splendidus]PTQ19791.1 hypothetical protein CWO14_09310 [Vibrio splendidus]
MSNIAYLSGWKPELCIQFEMENNLKADCNRFLLKGIPSTQQLQQGSQFEDANREGFILQLKEQFNETIKEGGSHESLYTLFNETSQYLQWCDKQSAPAFTQSSLEGYMAHQQTRVMLKELKNSTYRAKRAQMITLFVQYLELPHSYFDNVVIMDNSDKEPYEAYTRSDLNQLLPFLRQLFKQIYKQFIEDPDKHINAHKNVPTMTFQWKGKEYKLCGAISKMMCAATFLLAYYTYANTGDLFKLKQPNNASMTMGEVWYSMPAFKRRAFKTIQVEIGGHELEIPKYALDFFDKLLNASKVISTDAETTLLQTIASTRVQPIKKRTLQDFLRRWVEKHFSFTDQQGRRLRPVISRFRETGCQLTAYHQGEMVNDIMLNNRPNTRKQHYSEGNKLANKGMMQDAMSIREEQVKSGVSTKQALANLDINVLVIEEENKINLPELSRTSNGGSCASPFGGKSKKYTKKAQKQGLAKDGERLACADLLGCFGCPSQVVVQSVSDIWCLLSFKAGIEESLYLHLDASHYRKNFEDIVKFIEQKILPNISKKILKLAEKKLDDDGYHPLWDDSESILELIPKTVNEAY